MSGPGKPGVSAAVKPQPLLSAEQAQDLSAQQAQPYQHSGGQMSRFTRIDNFSGIYGFLHPDFPCRVTLLLEDEQAGSSGRSASAPSSSSSSSAGARGRRRDFPCATAALLCAEIGCVRYDALVASISPDADASKFAADYEDDYPDSARALRRAAERLREDDKKQNFGGASAQSWPTRRLNAAERVQRDKFHRNQDFVDQLLETGERPLVFENDVFDIFWGTVNGNGQNQLGRILELIRGSAKEAQKAAKTQDAANMWKDVDEWLYLCVQPNENKLTRKCVLLKEVKEGELVATHTLSVDMPIHFVGRQPDVCTLTPQHASTSRRHAAFVHSKSGFGVTDLHSKAGTRVNDCELSRGEFYCPLKTGDRVVIGQSTRHYEVVVDEHATQKMLADERAELLDEVQNVGQLELGQHLGDAATSQNRIQLFVGGLHADVRKSQLLTLFREEMSLVLGRGAFDSNARDAAAHAALLGIVEVRIPQEPGGGKGGKKGGKGKFGGKEDALVEHDAPNMQDLDDPKATRNFAFVTMANMEFARKAVLALDGYELEGRKMGVRISTTQPGDKSGGSKGAKGKDDGGEKGAGKDGKGSSGKMKGDKAYHMDNHGGFGTGANGIAVDKNNGLKGGFSGGGRIPNTNLIIESHRSANPENAAVARRFVEHAQSANKARESYEGGAGARGRLNSEQERKRSRSPRRDPEAEAKARKKEKKAAKKEKKKEKKAAKKEKKKEKKAIKKACKRAEKKVLKKKRSRSSSSESEKKLAKRKRDDNSSSSSSSEDEGSSSVSL
eukprot:g5765.t1